MIDTANKYVSCLNKCPAFCDCLQLLHPQQIVDCLNSDQCCQNCQTYTQNYNYPGYLYPQVFGKRRNGAYPIGSLVQNYHSSSPFYGPMNLAIASNVYVKSPLNQRTIRSLQRQVKFCDNNKVNNFMEGVQTATLGVPGCQMNDPVCQAGFLSCNTLNNYNPYNSQYRVPYFI
jgi:hypothetical protein